MEVKKKGTAKHVLGDVCDVEKRSDIFHIHPKNINVVEGWNARTDFTTDEDELFESIKAEGILQPLRVRKTEDKTLNLVSGERRLRAILRAIDEGCGIKPVVPVIVEKKGTSDEDLFFRDLNSNIGGRTLGAVEEAGAFKRAIGWGYSAQEIAARTGRSLSHVKNRLNLSNASKALQESVTKGETTITEAQTISKESGGDVEKQKSALEKRVKKIRNVVFRSSSPVQCQVIDKLFVDNEFKEAVTEAGYDIETMKITIRPLEVKS